jgi:putative tricarboxylic transport membrane protein
MDVRGESEPGPQFFPIIVICLLTLTGGWLTVGALLPRRKESEIWHRPDISEDMLADLSGTNTEVIQLEASRRRFRRGRSGAPSVATGAVPTDDDVPAFDWRTFGLVLGAVVVFAVLLEPVGWILSATLLFWIVAYALGSKRPVFDIGVGLLLSSLVQLAFGAGLGLNLPSGFIGWIF